MLSFYFLVFTSTSYYYFSQLFLLLLFSTSIKEQNHIKDVYQILFPSPGSLVGWGVKQNIRQMAAAAFFKAIFGSLGSNLRLRSFCREKVVFIVDRNSSSVKITWGEKYSAAQRAADWWLQNSRSERAITYSPWSGKVRRTPPSSVLQTKYVCVKSDMCKLQSGSLYTACHHYDMFTTKS